MGEDFTVPRRVEGSSNTLAYDPLQTIRTSSDHPPGVVCDGNTCRILPNVEIGRHGPEEDLDKPSAKYGGHSRNELAKIVAQRHHTAVDAAAKRKADPDYQPPVPERTPERVDQPVRPNPQETKREFSEAEMPEALRRAQAEHKEIVIRFTKESCPACNYMENSWHDQNVQDQMNKGALVVNVDCSRSSNLARQMGVNLLPTTVVVQPNDQGRYDVTGRHVGALSGEGLRRFLSQSGVDKR